MQHQLSLHRGGRVRVLATQILILVGFLMPAIGLAAVELRGAAAATTYCTTSAPDGGSFGSVTYTSYINVYTDPDCDGDDYGNRYVAYDYYSTASSTIWIDMGQVRLWICGTQYVGPNPGGANAENVNVWSGWTISNSCGFQADVSTYFSRSGYGSDWTYTNINT